MHDSIVLVFPYAVEAGLLMENSCTRANPPKTDMRSKKAIQPSKVQELVDAFGLGDMRECSNLPAITMGFRRGGLRARGV